MSYVIFPPSPNICQLAENFSLFAIPSEKADFEMQGGRYHGNYIGYQAWAKEDPYFADNIALDPAMDDKHAVKVFGAVRIPPNF